MVHMILKWLCFSIMMNLLILQARIATAAPFLQQETSSVTMQNENKVDEAIRLAELERLELARERLSRMVDQAVTVLEEEMATGGGSSTRLQAAREVLDRTGVARITGVDIR